MAKQKPKAKSSDSSPIHPDDVADFVAELDQHGDNPQPEIEETPPVLAQKVPVIAEKRKRRRAEAAATAAAVEQLDRVWHDQPAPPSEMQHLRRSTSRGIPWGMMIGILLLIAAVTIAGFFVFNPNEKFSGNNIQLQIDTVSQTASGSTVSLAVKFQNREPVDIVNAEVTLKYPDGFTYAKASRSPANEFNNAFTIGRVKSGQAGAVNISGVALGAVNDELEFEAVLAYRPANFSSDFTVKTIKKITINASTITLKVEGPAKLAPGAQGTWTVTYTNTSDEALKDLQLEAVYPDGFTATSAAPKATDGDNRWRIGALAKDKNGSVKLTGTLTGENGSSRDLLFRIGFIKTDGTVGLQAEESYLVLLVATGLQAAVAVNGETDGQAVDPGDEIQYTVKITNRGEEEVADITATATIAGAAADMSALENPSKATVKGSVLTWTKKEVAGLGLVKPGQDVTFNFTILAKKNLIASTTKEENPGITMTLKLSAAALPVTEGGTDHTTQVVTNIASVFNFTADARYYDDNGVPYGRGPVPPVVGQTTTYRVIWSVTNTTSEAENLTVSALLPATVSWTGQNVGRDAGDIAFDPATRTVTWTLNRVPAGTGTQLATLTARFEVSITPTSDQAGTSLVLTNAVTATATDSHSKKKFNLSAPPQTTDVPNDPQAAGEGTVRASA